MRNATTKITTRRMTQPAMMPPNCPLVSPPAGEVAATFSTGEGIVVTFATVVVGPASETVLATVLATDGGVGVILPTLFEVIVST
jgi:hypothetical protein